MEASQPTPGSLSWRLSSHPITLLFFLGFRICTYQEQPLTPSSHDSFEVAVATQENKPPLKRGASLLVYLFGMLFIDNLVMIFIITILLLAADFYYLKNIAGRRLVGLRWWNEVDPASGDSHWVFESSEPGTKTVNPTDGRFFWLAMYAQPLLWVALAILALVRLKFIWLPLVAIALVLTVTNTLAFSRCDKFSQASNMAGSAFYGGNLAGSIASNMAGRLFSFGR